MNNDEKLMLQYLGIIFVELVEVDKLIVNLIKTDENLVLK